MSQSNEALIQCSGLVKTYRLGDETVHALDNVSLSIREGEFVSISGPSGSGKSTLANIIGGLDQPDSGSVMVCGMDLSKARDKALSHYRNDNVGFVFQSFNLQVHETALENVMSPLTIGAKGGRKERREKALAALEKVGLADRAKHKPTQLSGGQRQRVAIARALVNSPRIVIADEPTGNLDSTRGAAVMDELKRLNKQEGMTLLVITHDPNVAAMADRVLTIIDGKLTDSGVAR
jgi:putative ABC transport system ATP-binding protein